MRFRSSRVQPGQNFLSKLLDIAASWRPLVGDPYHDYTYMTAMSANYLSLFEDCICIIIQIKGALD